MKEVRRIDTKYFYTTISDLRNSIAKYREAREKVFKATSELESSWEGEGKEKFRNEFVLLKTKLNDQEDNLREMALMLEKIALEYEEFDADVSSNIQNASSSNKSGYGSGGGGGGAI